MQTPNRWSGKFETRNPPFELDVNAHVIGGEYKGVVALAYTPELERDILVMCSKNTCKYYVIPVDGDNNSVGIEELPNGEVVVYNTPLGTVTLSSLGSSMDFKEWVDWRLSNS